MYSYSFVQYVYHVLGRVLTDSVLNPLLLCAVVEKLNEVYQQLKIDKAQMESRIEALEMRPSKLL